MIKKILSTGIEIAIVGYWAARALTIWIKQEQVTPFDGGMMAACIAYFAALIYWGFGRESK